MDNPVKKGFLLFPPQGVFSQIKKSWQKKYCELYHVSKYGIERLEVFDSEDEASTNLSPRIITLENCVKITPDPPKLEPNVFVIVTKSSTYYFSAPEEHEKREWVSAFQSVAFKEFGGCSAVEEYNDLYCSSREGTFLVKLVPSEASFRCGLEPGPYTLLLTSSAIQLWDANQQSLLVTWPYCFIRRYGYCDGKFTFEAGRMCDTGEGKFLVEHPNQQEIYRSVALKMKSMRKMMGGESGGQLSVAMSMEARSRSPLPPSPSPCPPGQEHPATLRARAASQGNLVESNRLNVSPSVETNPLLVINAPAHLKPRVFSASHGALDLLTCKSPTLFHAKVVDIDLPNESMPSLQQKPAKPPRRPVMAEKVLYWPRNQNSSSSKPTDDYDDVEVREEAWKTLGTSEPNHTEDYEPIEAVETPRKVETLTPIISPIRPKFLPLKPTSELGNYDTLQYFGSGKFNPSKSVYKQVTLSPTSPDSPISPSAGSVTPTFHDYDEVAEQRLGGVRHAEEEEAHHGYGIIRRIPDHKLFNNLEYAIVTKPRQV